MLKLDDKDKSAKSRVLQEIMDMMDGHQGSKLKDLKKPAAVEMSVAKLSPEDAAGDDKDDAGDSDDPMSGFGKSWDKPDETPDGDADEGSDGKSEGPAPSPEEIANIKALYEKYCK